jgi:hypothetical protein
MSELKRRLRNMTDIQLPDFEAMMHAVDEIADLAVEVSMQKIKVKMMEVMTVRRGVEEGFPMNRIESAYKFAGFDDEILPEREKSAGVEAALEAARTKLSISQSMVDVWRTVEANKRLTLS